MRCAYHSGQDDDQIGHPADRSGVRCSAKVLVLSPLDPRQPAAFLMRPCVAASSFVIGIVLIVLVLIVAPLSATALTTATVGGGLVGCGAAGLYCWSRRRTGRM